MKYFFHLILKKIKGVEKLKGCEYTPIPDRIVAGTYLIACGMCGGEVFLKTNNTDYLRDVRIKDFQWCIFLLVS